MRLACRGRISAVDNTRRRIRRVGTEVGPTDTGNERVARRPTDRRTWDQRSELGDRRLLDLSGAVVTRGREHRDSAVGRGNEGVPQVLQRIRTAKRSLGRAEALCDDVREMMVDDV